MDSTDGLKEYRKNPDYWKFTVGLEEFAKEILTMLSRYGSEPPKGSLSRTKQFLLEIERWKAMCIQDQMGMASRNSEPSIWNALQSAVKARTDTEAFLSVMSLIGFGAYPDIETGLRRAKRATAVLRFLKPYDWGVVDWRTVAMLGLLKKCDWDVDRVLVQAKRENPRDLRRDLDIINEDWACQINQEYRAMRTERLPRAADVDMALFGISLIAWPI